jgi:hypothetical protein
MVNGMVVAAGEQRVLQISGIIRRSTRDLARDTRVDGLSPQAAEQLLDDTIASEKSLAALKLFLADRAAESNGWRARGARSPQEDLARKAGTSVGEAKGLLDAAKKVKDQPVVQDALRDGKLSQRQAEVITDAAAANPAAQDDLVRAAGSGPLSALRDKAGRVKAAADKDPEGTHRRIHASRFHRRGRDSDGAITGSYRVTPEAGAKLDAFLEPFVSAEARKAKQEGRNDTLEQLAADALVAMAEAAALGGGVTGVKTKTHVHVLVDHDALLRGCTQGEERCEVTTCFGPLPVPVSVVQEILDDAFLSALFVKGTDVQAAVRFGRHIPAAVKEAIQIRADFTCSVEGCGRRARLEMDHTHPHGKGGETSYRNLKPLCTFHHREKTRQDRLFDPTRAPP